MAETFDPYYKWFGIRPEDQPPDFYRLLGVEAFETDFDVISNAADQRMTHLRSMQTGPHAIESQRILNEVSKARVTLLDAERKLAYDVSLRKKIAAAAAAKRGPSMAPSVLPAGSLRGAAGVEPLEPLASVDALDLADDELRAAAGSSRSAGRAFGVAGARGRARGYGRHAAAVLAGAAIGGIVALAALVVVLGKFAGVDPLGLFLPADAVVETGGQRHAADDGADSSASDSAYDRQDENGDASAKAAEREKPAVPTRSADNQNTAATGKDDADSTAAPVDAPGPIRNGSTAAADATPIDPFRDLAAYAALPPTTEAASHELFLLDVASSALEEVALVTSAADLEAGQSFDIIADGPTGAGHWQIRATGDGENSSAAGTLPLADLWIERGAMHFRWLASAVESPITGQVQNCLLMLRVAGKVGLVALRSPAFRPPLVLDLSTPASLIDVALEAPPRVKTLVFEVGPLDELPRVATAADERRRAAFASPMREKVVIAFDLLDEENRPQVAVEPLATRKGLQLRVTPSVVNAGGGFSLSLARVEEIKKNFGVRKIRTDKQWKDLQQRMAMLRTQIANLDKQLLSFPPQQAALQRQRDLAAAQLREAEAAFEKADADKTQIDTMLDTMPAVEELIGELHKKAKLPFRIVAIVSLPEGEAVEVEIVRAMDGN